jgi:hypothetical protein
MRNIKTAPERVQKGRDQAAQENVRPIGFWWTQGTYDAVTVVDFPFSSAGSLSLTPTLLSARRALSRLRSLLCADRLRRSPVRSRKRYSGTRSMLFSNSTCHGTMPSCVAQLALTGPDASSCPRLSGTDSDFPLGTLSTWSCRVTSSRCDRGAAQLRCRRSAEFGCFAPASP